MSHLLPLAISKHAVDQFRTRWGGAAWLRHYYPSLYQQLAAWMPDAGAYT